MTSDAAAAQWARCKGWIEAALPYGGGTHTIEDIEAGIASGQYAFWPGNKSAAITEVLEYPRARYLHIPFAGGDLDELRAMVPSWQSWASYLGCSRLTILGRRGWERALRSQGWTPELVLLALPATSELKQ